MNQQNLHGLIALIAGIVFFIAGVIMMFLGITATGSIDVQSAFVAGKITTGSAGVFVTAFAVVIILGSFFAKRHEQTSSTSKPSAFQRILSVYKLLIAAMAVLLALFVFVPEVRTLTGLLLGFGAFVLFLLLIPLIDSTGEDH